MSDPVEVCEAVIERLRPVLPGWNALLFEPSLIPVPAYVVELVPTKGADYVQVDGDYTLWFVRVVLFVAANTEDGSLRRMSPLVGSKGAILGALKDTLDDCDDALSKLSRHVHPTTLSGFTIVRRNKNRYRSATVAVTVGG